MKSPFHDMTEGLRRWHIVPHRFWKFAIMFDDGKKFFVASIQAAYAIASQNPSLTFRLVSANMYDHERSEVHH